MAILLQAINTLPDTEETLATLVDLERSISAEMNKNISRACHEFEISISELLKTQEYDRELLKAIAIVKSRIKTKLEIKTQ